MPGAVAGTGPLPTGPTDLLRRYCELIDAGDFDALGGLFADGTLRDENGTEIAAGAAAVTAFYRSAVILHDGSPRTRHLVLDPVAEVDDGAGEATVRSSYLVLQGLEGRMEPIVTGRYHDRFARGADGWHFVERVFFVDLAGDLSRHLTFGL